jgi:hypothetical protein
MKRLTAFSLIILTLVFASALHAQSGRDTIQTFTYGSPAQAKFLFPPLSEKVERIIMHYKLRCPPGVQCGEWDYLMYTYLYDHTGVQDSVTDTIYSFKVNGQIVATQAFDWKPTMMYLPKITYSVTRLSRTSFDSAIVGAGTHISNSPLETSTDVSRSQYVWRASELTSAGLKKGDITGMRFNTADVGSVMNNLTVRMKLSTKDSLVPSSYEFGKYTTVYSHNTAFASSGWNRIDFPTSFTWDGSSNIVVDISFDNHLLSEAGAVVRADSLSYSSGITTLIPKNSLHFENNDCITVPPQALVGCDSAITISFWQYGNPKYLPQNESSFEAINSQGQRVLNAHVPWSDGTVYWDAGSTFGGYDRISKAADSNDYKGKWTYWTFTKNVKTGIMNIYQNGILFTSGTAKKALISDVQLFHLGCGSNGDNNFDGNIDEFAIWNTELPAAAVAAVMGTDASANASYKKYLRVYYRSNVNNQLVLDESGNSFSGHMTGLPTIQRTRGLDLYQGFTSIHDRPQVVFEEGVYTSKFDTTVTLDSTGNDVMQIIRYSPSANGPVVRDTLYTYPRQVNYTFTKTGTVKDSSVLAADTTMTLVKTPYFRKFEVVNRYEIARYITEYGNPTSPTNTLAAGGEFTWDYDVSDYRTLLHDSVELNSYNQQELVNVTFEFIKGTPPRDPISVKNLWNGDFWYGTNTPIETWLHPIRVNIPAAALNTKIKIRPTGHGGGDQENCSEFCPKDHWILIDTTERWRQNVWRTDCGLNPLYPQGGTWVYSRTNWCPGSDVHTYDFELTPFVKPGDSATFDYKITPYTSNGGGNTPNWVIETQLISYGKPNFTRNAAITEIKSPSSTNLFARHNPICGNPVVTIQNRGSAPLTSLDITYGIVGGSQSVHHWTGNLAFMDTTDVELGKFAWASDSKRFEATVSLPTGDADEYPGDNTLQSDFTIPPVYPSQLVFEYKTNAAPEENSYVLLDIDDKVILQRGDNLNPNTYYRDTITLPDGCYKFIMTDVGEGGAGDGLSWWANPNQGTGSMKIKKATGNTTLKTFATDFGNEIYQQFNVGNFAGVPEVHGGDVKLDVFPNPAPKKFTVVIAEPYPQDLIVAIYDILGNEVYKAYRKEVTTDNISVDLGDQASGTYIVRIVSESGVTSKKVIIK